MEEEHYQNIYNYLLFQQVPTSFSIQQTQQLDKQSKHYQIEDEILYKKDRNNSTKFHQVIQKRELSALLYMMHNDPISGYFVTDAMFNKIKTRYYWPQFYNNIKKYVESCDSCQ